MGRASTTPTDTAAHASVRGWAAMSLGGDQPGAGIVQGDVGAADARRAGAAVGLQDVAVEGDLHLAHGPQVGDGPQRPADQPLDLLGPARLASPGRLPVDALRAGPGQHRVLGGDPALARSLASSGARRRRPRPCTAPWSGPWRPAPTRRRTRCSRGRTRPAAGRRADARPRLIPCTSGRRRRPRRQRRRQPAASAWAASGSMVGQRWVMTRRWRCRQPGPWRRPAGRSGAAGSLLDREERWPRTAPRSRPGPSAASAQPGRSRQSSRATRPPPSTRTARVSGGWSVREKVNVMRPERAPGRRRRSSCQSKGALGGARAQQLAQPRRGVDRDAGPGHDVTAGHGEALEVGPVVGVLVGEDHGVDRRRGDVGCRLARVPDPASSQTAVPSQRSR